MSELARAKQQYFKLMRLVNKNHELTFEVNNDKLFAVIGLNQRILLCEKQAHWMAVYATQLFELEDFLAKFMNKQKIINEKLTEQIRLALFGHSR